MLKNVQDKPELVKWLIDSINDMGNSEQNRREMLIDCIKRVSSEDLIYLSKHVNIDGYKNMLNMALVSPNEAIVPVRKPIYLNHVAIVSPEVDALLDSLFEKAEWGDKLFTYEILAILQRKGVFLDAQKLRLILTEKGYKHCEKFRINKKQHSGFRYIKLLVQ